jgi:putative transposase
MSRGIFNKYTGYHHRRSIRLDHYDYSRPGRYFITNSIHDRKIRLFGDVKKGKMIENEIAGIVRRWWYDIPDHFIHIGLDEFIIMPNHIHGIIIIRDSVGAGSSRPLGYPGSCLNTINDNNKYAGVCMNGRDDPNIVGRDDRAPTLGMVMGYFKYQSTKQINAYRDGIIRKIWQRNYYDHIIRNIKSLYMIRQYIRNNPAAWEKDREHHLQNEIALMYPEK